MFEILLSACLIGQPGNCHTDRLSGGETLAACRAQAREVAAAYDPAQEVQSFPCVTTGETPDFTISEIAPGVFVHKGQQDEANPDNGGDIANLGFVIGKQAVAVVDAGSSAHLAEHLIEAIGKETDLPIKWLILTHMHPDHSLGAGVFAAAGAQVLVHTHLPDALRARASGYAQAMQASIGDSAFAGTEVFIPDETVDGMREIDLGDRVLTIQSYPTGHTNNDMSVYDPQTQTLFAGDLVFMGSLPALDGSLTGWMKDLDSIETIPAMRVVPGHGPVSAPWPQATGAMRAYLDVLAKETRAAIARGEPMIDAVEEIAQSEREKWLLFDLYNPRNASAAFAELEWE